LLLDGREVKSHVEFHVSFELVVLFGEIWRLLIRELDRTLLHLLLKPHLTLVVLEDIFEESVVNDAYLAFVLGGGVGALQGAVVHLDVVLVVSIRRSVLPLSRRHRIRHLELALQLRRLVVETLVFVPLLLIHSRLTSYFCLLSVAQLEVAFPDFLTHLYDLRLVVIEDLSHRVSEPFSLFLGERTHFVGFIV